MKKSDLKTGYKVTTRIGYKYTVVLDIETDYFIGDAIIDRREGTFNWLDLNDFSDDLKLLPNPGGSEYDIIIVERPSHPYDIFYTHRGSTCIWSRDEDE